MPAYVLEAMCLTNPQIVDHLPTEPPGVDCINLAFETADVGEICHSIGTATRLYNISDLAHRSGIERQTVYRAFAGGPKHPNLNTVLDAMGFQLHVTVRRGTCARLARLKAFRIRSLNGNLRSAEDGALSRSSASSLSDLG